MLTVVAGGGRTRGRGGRRRGLAAHGQRLRASAKRGRAAQVVADAEREAETLRREAQVEAREEAVKLRAEIESEVRDRRVEIAKVEERVAQREAEIEGKLVELDAARAGGRRSRGAPQAAPGGAEGVEATARSRSSSGSRHDAGEAKPHMLERSEDLVRHELARRVRQMEEEARGRGEAACTRTWSPTRSSGSRRATPRRRRSPSSSSPSDDMKGRIIGREGRNIRALEHLTGVDFIVDDTPHAVVLSSFDGIRREIAQLTLEKLIEDGRIHPARIEEMYYQSKSELDEQIHQAGSRRCSRRTAASSTRSSSTILGRLRYRTSYGQNVLKHTLEVVHLAGLMAAELGAGVKTAKRAALLHDIGKAMTHEVEGSHALVSAQLARRYGESEGVVHAIEAHHYEVQPQTVEAVLVIAADAVSASRPGARGESLEHYIKRLSALEEIATSKAGVSKAYALQAGREIRVIVEPSEVDDDGTALLSYEIARQIEDQLEYPGQVKVIVIRGVEGDRGREVTFGRIGPAVCDPT